MEIRQLETFVVVAEEGRCVAAARRLSISPAAVTARLDRLEQGLGVRLLRRTTRHVGLTPAGARLLPQVRELVRAVVALNERVIHVREGREGVLRIATLAHRRATAARIAGALRRAVPGWEVQIAVVGRRAMLDVFRDDLADVAVGCVRASRSQVRRIGIGGPSASGETIAWRRALPARLVAAIARVAEQLGAIVRRRSYRGPTQEMQWLSSVFAAVERMLVASGYRDAGGAASVAGAGAVGVVRAVGAAGAVDPVGAAGAAGVTRPSDGFGRAKARRGRTAGATGAGLLAISRRRSGNGGGGGP